MVNNPTPSKKKNTKPGFQAGWNQNILRSPFSLPHYLGKLRPHFPPSPMMVRIGEIPFPQPFRLVSYHICSSDTVGISCGMRIGNEPKNNGVVFHIQSCSPLLVERLVIVPPKRIWGAGATLTYVPWSSHHHACDSRWMGWWSSLIWFTGLKWIYIRSNGKEYDVYQFSPFSITDSRWFQGKIGLVATSCSKTLRRRPGRCAGRFLSQHQGFT